jgi:hypothetical protein
MSPDPSRRVIVWIVLAAIALTACGSDRPSVAEWQPTWERITATIPDEEAVADGLSVATCGEALAFLRSNRSELTPTPDLAIDDVVTAWIEIAEDAFFECPPDNEQIRDFSEAYAEMLRLEAEVELVLEMDR